MPKLNKQFTLVEKMHSGMSLPSLLYATFASICSIIKNAYDIVTYDIIEVYIGGECAAPLV